VSFKFELHTGTATSPRLGTLKTPHGEVATPAFMPVATRGMMRGVSHDRLRPMGVEMMLANAFHLFTRPGVESVRALGRVHGMMAWNGPVLTDSGGFQVFSLSKFFKLHENGVAIKDPITGDNIDWTPQLAFDVQAGLGPDIAMLLDHCPDQPADRDLVASAVKTTLRWASEQRELHNLRGGADSGQAQFGIVQGGVFADLRAECAASLAAMDFDGYAVGGVSVGEEHRQMMIAVDASTAVLPAEKIRYLMGVGTPLDLVEAVARGIDLFDCVLPTRAGRFGTALTNNGRLHLHNAKFKDDTNPIEPGCQCSSCLSGIPRGALRAGFKAKELNPSTLLATHNLHFIIKLMERIRHSIANNSFAQLRQEIAIAYPPKPANSDLG